jgi:ABC-type amino acid transport substrate-binding protein
MRTSHQSTTARLLSIALSFSVLLPGGSAFAVQAEETAPTPVKVGFFSNGDFMKKTAEGSYSGYDIEYYDELAGYADWSIAIQEYTSLADATAALENGDIDILSGMSKTTEREGKFLFSATKMCSPKIAVQVRADEDRFTISDPSSMSDMTCGILQKSNVVALYQNWCTQYGLNPHIIEYESIDARNAALAAKEVDAIAGGSTIAGAQKLAEFPSLDLYFMINSSRTDLKEQLDRSMAVLSLENPTLS